MSSAVDMATYMSTTTWRSIVAFQHKPQDMADKHVAKSIARVTEVVHNCFRYLYGVNPAPKRLEEVDKSKLFKARNSKTAA